ncbi:Protein of unknown function [Jatrophihabitans endophyticus]|uniref:DUF721 domain-containing protein n=1 Tax=Jatrophihabitans endophyticus TaxID=1206085 RepID=A0A1M5HWA6_9ACTN|nr:DciA family protein [Jatrophihabitans endophyticus]SHG20241.1 Protein of unknown function [Jatrophihabitans endophyticus]
MDDEPDAAAGAPQDETRVTPPGEPAQDGPAEIGPAGTDPAGTDPAGTDPAETDLARAALAGARETARGRPARRYDRDTRNRIRRDNLAGRNGSRNTGGYSGPGHDPARDPQRVGQLLGGLVDDQGWERPLAEARVFADWSTLVGEDVAAHATPQTLTAGELRIAAESTAWATQLRLLAATLLARLVAELGPDVVTKLIITGPVAPSWRHGGRSVRGARGPRDTYG